MKNKEKKNGKGKRSVNNKKKKDIIDQKCGDDEISDKQSKTQKW